MTSGSSDSMPLSTTEKPSGRMHTVHTNERVPEHTNYYEKDGLRTEGDDEDHAHEPPVRLNSMSTTG